MKKLLDRHRHQSLNRDKPASSSNGADLARNDNHGWLSAMSLVTFSFMLVLIMATALFVTVGINPKQATYGKLPWVYAIACLAGSAACGIISYFLDRDETLEVKAK
jgi:hypothetical protein